LPIAPCVDNDRRDLWDDYLSARDIPARNRLVESYRELADRIARGFAARRVVSGSGGVVELDDLVGLAREGMIRAVETYDPGRGVPFEAYARVRVGGHVRDVLRDGDDLSRRDRQTVRAYLTGEPLEDRRSRRAARLVAERPLRSEAPVDAGEVPDDVEVEPAVLTRLEVEEMLRTLPPVEATVVEYRYLRGMSLSAIGATLALTESRVSQIHRVAIERLRGAAGWGGAAIS